METDDDIISRQAVARLTPRQRELVGACLQAIVDGPYIPDWEFPTVMGLGREEVSAIASAWPTVSGDNTFIAVNNTLNSLLGYPHGEWTELAAALHADERAVAEALLVWRAQDPPVGGSGSAYFDHLM